MGNLLKTLPYVTIRIRTGDGDGGVHTGTGFFFRFPVGDKWTGLIVSNKHVLSNKLWVEADFALLKEDGSRALGRPTTIRVRGLPVFNHPDPGVDLAAIPLEPFRHILEQHGLNPYVMNLSPEAFANSDLQQVLHAGTTTLMVGFPNGIMDEVNNLPVVRRGILATPFLANYQGKDDFVVDIAAFGGSSGSPVFAFFEGLLPKEGGVAMLAEPLIAFLGVLHSGPTMTREGKIVPAPVPTSFVARTEQMIHLGYCVKAERLRDLEGEIVPTIGRELNFSYDVSLGHG